MGLDASAVSSRWPAAMRVRMATACLCVVLLPLAFGACRSTAALERESLTAALGRDPLDVLRTIGSAPNAATARARIEALRDAEWTAAQRLQLIRFGLAHDDERVVFGATMLMGEQLPVPELRNAAAVVLPRLGDPDCPVSSDQARQLIGSGDFAAAAAAVPKLSELDAVGFLGGLHRMVRPNSIPVSCALARATVGAVRRQAFENATLGVEYSGEYTPLLVATWLELVGRAPDADPIGPGIPGALTAALRAHLEWEEEPKPPENEIDRRTPGLPVVPCARWLAAITPSAADVPLLRQLLEVEEAPLSCAATWALGAVDDATARSVLKDEEDPKHPTLWMAARARSGDADALEALLTGDPSGILHGLELASPERRRVWFRQLLERPREDAAAALAYIVSWEHGDYFESFCDPLHDERILAELEPTAASMARIDAQVLRALVGMPCCQTTRLADRLLQLPAAELFADAAEYGVLSGASERWPGRCGVWAFLEVTRPDTLRTRLHEGFAGEDEGVRDFCAELLVRLGDTAQLKRLAAWLAEAERQPNQGWIDLARDGGPAVVTELKRRLADAKDARAAAPLLPALATSLGMPLEFARTWTVYEEDVPAVREALLAGDAVAAILRSEPEFSSQTARLAQWSEDGPRAFARRERNSADASLLREVYQFDQEWALATQDHTELARMLGPVRDGRYATHSYFSPHTAAFAEGLAMLPFWIDELGSNCCKCVFVKQVMDELFGCNGDAFMHHRFREPTAVILRRTLLPVADRLRWSRIVDAYVVAGT